MRAPPRSCPLLSTTRERFKGPCRRTHQCPQGPHPSMCKEQLFDLVLPTASGRFCQLPRNRKNRHDVPSRQGQRPPPPHPSACLGYNTGVPDYRPSLRFCCPSHLTASTLPRAHLCRMGLQCLAEAMRATRNAPAATSTQSRPTRFSAPSMSITSGACAAAAPRPHHAASRSCRGDLTPAESPSGPS